MSRSEQKYLTPYAKALRKDMTDMERKLWFMFLRGLPVRFYRQRPIGKYIVDFYCAKARIAVELDGSQHYEADGMLSDEERDEYLNEQGITVLRYSDRDVAKNFDGVCEDILIHLKRMGISPFAPDGALPPKGGSKKN